jgi:hypothetical protein
MGIHQYVFSNMLFHWSYNTILNLFLIVFLDLENEQVWNNTTLQHMIQEVQMKPLHCR